MEGATHRRTFLTLAASLPPSAVLAPSAAFAQSAPTTVRVGVIPSEVCGQVFYGIDRGFFRRRGQDVQIQFFNNGGAIAAAVAGGALDIGLADLASAVTAHARNVPIAYVAPGLLYADKAPTFAIIVAKNSPVREAKDLQGAFASSGLANIAQLATEAWIDRNGGNLKNLKFLEMPPPVVQNALTQGTIQASTANEPWLTLAGDAGFPIITMTNGLASTYMLSGWVATKETIRSKPQLIEGFVAAIKDASIWANENRANSAPILAKYTKISPTVIGHMRRGQFAVRWDDALIQPAIDAAVRYGRIGQGFPAADLFYGGR